MTGQFSYFHALVTGQDQQARSTHSETGYWVSNSCLGTSRIEGGIICMYIYCLAKKEVVISFLNQQIVVLWSGVASVDQVKVQQVSRVPECTEWPGYPINAFFSGIFQDDNSKIHSSSSERVEHEDTRVSGSMRSHFHTWIGHHRVLTLPH